MICCLCLKYAENINNIFDEVDTQHQHLAAIVGKYFWFEPRKDDAMSTAICSSCCNIITEFHHFYEMVETAHKRFRTTESVIIKTEDAPVDFSSLPSKNEPTDVFDDEFSEVPFSAKANTIDVSNLTEDSHDALSQTDVIQYEEKNGSCNGSDDDLIREDVEVSEDTETIGQLYNSDGSLYKEASDEQCSKIKPDVKTTKSRKSARLLGTSVKKESQTERKKAKKLLTYKNKECVKPKKTKSKEKTNTNNEEQMAYKDKMKSFDTQISQYMGLHCDICNVAAENFAGLKLHMRVEHNMENGYVKCCDKKFHRRANLLYHIRHHVDPNCYSCEECKRAFSDYQSLRNHINVKHQKEEDKIYECPECSKKFAKKYLLEQHKTFRHKDRIKKCKMCNRRYETMEELNEHNKEPCVAGIMCDICAKVIYGPAAFKRHQLDHQDDQGNKEQCDLCGSWHRDKYALKKHKRRHLEPKKPHVCDICNKISPSREAMISHKRYAHSTDRTFECEFCQKSFKKALSLKEHMTTHTGEVLYTCPHCPKTFNSNANMHSHRKNAHPREFEEARKRRKRVVYVKDLQALASSKPCTESVLQSIKESNGTLPEFTKADTHDLLMYDAN